MHYFNSIILSALGLLIVAATFFMFRKPVPHRFIKGAIVMIALALPASGYLLHAGAIEMSQIHHPCDSENRTVCLDE